MDLYEQRSKDAKDTCPGAQRAGARIARRFNLRGSADPAYIANIVQRELDRSKGASKTPAETSTHNDFSGWALDQKIPYERIRGLMRKDAVRATDVLPPGKVTPHQARAARTAAALIFLAYDAAIRSVPTEDDTGDEFDEAERLGDLVELIAEGFSSGPRDEALAKIQAYRRRAGLPALDASSWTDDDVVAEAERLKGEGRVSNPRVLKRRLLK